MTHFAVIPLMLIKRSANASYHVLISFFIYLA